MERSERDALLEQNRIGAGAVRHAVEAWLRIHTAHAHDHAEQIRRAAVSR